MIGLFTSLFGTAWSRLSGWAALLATLIAALGIAWLKGRAAGKAAWETKRQAARDSGRNERQLRLLHEDGYRCLRNGETSLEELLRVTRS